jgi:protein-tyrosine phosphatase
MADDRFTVLFVCHANICRSPMAERLARRTLTPGTGGTVVVSAGTHAWAGYAMHPFTARVLAERGADHEGFGSRRLSAPIVDSADLILTASRNQRAAAATLSPAAARRTFTLRQFGRYAAALARLPAPPPADSAVLAGGCSPTPQTGSGCAPAVLAGGCSPTPQTGSGCAPAVHPLRALLDRVTSVRGQVQPLPADQDDLPDPVSGPLEDFRACADEIQHHLDTMVRLTATT